MEISRNVIFKRFKPLGGGGTRAKIILYTMVNPEGHAGK